MPGSQFQGTNTPTPGNTFSVADGKLNPTLKEYWFGSREAAQQEISSDITSRWSHLITKIHLDRSITNLSKPSSILQYLPLHQKTLLLVPLLESLITI